MAATWRIPASNGEPERITQSFEEVKLFQAAHGRPYVNLVLGGSRVKPTEKTERQPAVVLRARA